MLPTTQSHAVRPRPTYLSAVAILGGLIDPFIGVFIAALRIFWPTRLPARADTPRRRRRGLTLVLGGIEGPSRFAAAMARGVLTSAYRGSVVLFPWNQGIPLLCPLRNHFHRRRQRRMADKLANLIIEYKARHPDAPVCLIAQSGGCWIAVRALEILPPGSRVRTAVLLAPSISPGHDLSVAASRCDDALVSVRGLGDLFFLGLFTLLAGTSDRAHTPSAGWIGWRRPHPDGLVDLQWCPAWIKHGYIGNHTTTSATPFIARIIAPRFKEARSQPSRCRPSP